MDSLGIFQCENQGKLFEFAASEGYDCKAFIDLFMNSSLAMRLDFPFSSEQQAPVEVLWNTFVSEIDGQLGLTGANNNSPTDFIEAMYWAGYIYRYWHLYTGESSKRIYAQADAANVLNVYPAFHSLDNKMAVDNFKEIYKAKLEKQYAPTINDQVRLKGLHLLDFTVFQDLELEFSPGINVFIGENGLGKTHILKVLYSATKAVSPEISFPQKLARVFRPDDFSIGRLVRRYTGKHSASVSVSSSMATLTTTFNVQTAISNSKIVGERNWKKQFNLMSSTFIPAKEILSNAWNLAAAVNKNNVIFDDTYLDIIADAKVDISIGRNSDSRKKYLKLLQQMMDGTVLTRDERFYLKPGNKANIEFSLVAEGVRKLGLLWTLIKNGTLEKGSVLFWDEPEANINPKYIPTLVDMLLMLQRSGVQIFLSTHDYFLARYLEIRKEEIDDILFFSLYKDPSLQDPAQAQIKSHPEVGGVLCEVNPSFSALKENSISTAFQQLLNEVSSNTTLTTMP